MRRAPILLALVALLLAACGEPLSREKFIRSNGSGEYFFPVQMSDSTASYDISFYTKIDKVVMRPDTLASFPMQLVWRSPSRRYFSETVYYPAHSLRVCYRRDLVPSEPGDWTLSVTISPEPAGLRGLGLVVEKKKHYGDAE